MLSAFSSLVLRESTHVLACDFTWQRPGSLKQENRMKTLSKWLMATCLLASSVVAQDLTQGLILKEQKRYAEALKIILPLAHDGDVAAQLHLATMYFEGLGLKQDQNAALYWACRASKTGDFSANKFRIKLSLRSISESYSPEPCNASD